MNEQIRMTKELNGVRSSNFLVESLLLVTNDFTKNHLRKDKHKS